MGEEDLPGSGPEPAGVIRTFGGPDAHFYSETVFTSAETGDRALVAEPGHDYVFASEDDVPADGRWFPQGEGPTQPEQSERDYMHGIGQPPITEQAESFSPPPEPASEVVPAPEPEG